MNDFELNLGVILQLKCNLHETIDSDFSDDVFHRYVVRAQAAIQDKARQEETEEVQRDSIQRSPG
jgi:hypothetical protein